MNVAVRTLNQVNILPNIFTQSLSIKHYIFIIILAIAVLLTSIGLICVQNTNRQLTSYLETLQTNNATQHNKWSQLLLEKSAWTSSARIEQLAHNKLKMVIPKKQNIITI